MAGLTDDAHRLTYNLHVHDETLGFREKNYETIFE